MAKVTAPVRGITEKILGVNFADSVGETDDEGALNYFRRHGYTVEEVEPEPEPGKDEKSEPDKDEKSEPAKATPDTKAPATK